jgi:pimeloyl-ACP methyl ester carboxylesterase
VDEATAHARARSDRSILIETGDVQLAGDLVVPAGAHGVILFAHGSGSSRHSPRNRLVAAVLEASGLATLLIDLLTEEEDAIDQQTRHLRFDIPMLGERLTSALDWLAVDDVTADLPVGLFGASTGAGAAILAAHARADQVRAIVSRGGRPDLANETLMLIGVPTLLIVGGNDEIVLGLNQWALEMLPGVKELVVIPGASHLFVEPGTLDTVSERARDWFLGNLGNS